jgi:hypothetical protein
MVTNTGEGQLIFYNQNLERTKIIDFSKLHGITEEAEGREWLQFVREFSPGKYIAVDSNRACLLFIDEHAQTIRRVAIPPNWVIQEAHILNAKPLVDRLPS